MTSRLRLQRARQELESSRQELRNFADSVPHILWAAGPDGRLDFLNQRFEDLTGLDPKEALRNGTWTAPLHPEDREPYVRSWLEAPRDGSEVRSHFRARHRDGSYRWMHSVGRSVVSPETGRVLRWYGGLTDVDAEFKAQEMVRELNQTLEQRVEERTREMLGARWRYRSLFHDENIGVLELDIAQARAKVEALRAEGFTDPSILAKTRPALFEEVLGEIRLVEINETCSRIFGYSDGGQELLERRPQENRLGGRPVLLKHIEALFAGEGGFSGSVVMRRADGSRLVAAYTAKLSEEGVSFVTVVDISEREKTHELLLAAQNEMSRANRVATIGALSVSIAHELNQPITSLSVDIDTALRTLDKPSQDPALLGRLLTRLKRNAERLAGIVQRTRNQASNQQAGLEEVELDAMARETAALLERDVERRHAVLHLRIEPDLPRVEAEPVAVQQVLVNLIVNALEATESLPIKQRVVTVSIARKGPQAVMVKVTDAGNGIDPDILEKIFDPFFTTKGEGVGMGLQICRSAIESMGGDIRAGDAPEGGALFEFTLMTV
ncbi:ATP-binding protein [Brevundimonas vesicularis]|uniref:ATP-binding protein n=1 Tax=Brevundimonas vesicularis TaxID=41276 RepID=UPI0021A9FB1D|nr:ATP-binding protein [Brevundimonas vesicularis]